VAVCQAAGAREADEFEVDLAPLFDDDDNVVRGTSTIEFCRDAEGDDTEDDEFGCADEEATASLSKTYVGQAVSVDLVFAGTGDNTTGDVCAGGDKFKTNTEGDDDTLVACTYDALGNLVSTDIGTFTADDDTENDGNLDWANSAPGSVAFAGNPPNDTGENGTATLDIQAVNEGSSTLTVILNFDEDNDGDIEAGEDDSASITKTVQEQTGGGDECNDGVDNDGDGDIDYPADDGCASIDDDTENSDGVDPTVNTHDRTVKITKFAHVKLPGKKRPALKVRGVVNSPDFESCAQTVPVKVQIRAGGSWVTRKSDTTNENGVFKVLIRDVKGKYRARATKYQIEDTDTNTLDVCRKAGHVKRHRHRR
jgi:hypothetical protein